ncbi:hypothetical protein E8E12_005139 [Didymella heteroderae]|uniref:Serine protein kinase n=1 Tax=Didymella heteroderae TaxID=1769908 RepID=A0A9P4WSK2_9PLEO|nr:hypothetical protein E8E12_005139 [Didymella heteroderae]
MEGHSSDNIVPLAINPDFVSFDRGDCTVVLRSSASTYTLTQTFFSSAKNTILVYAEKIKLESSLLLNGKTLGLFCNELLIPQSVQCTIDVSGLDGPASTPSVTDDGPRGADGSSSGSVYIYVQQPTDAWQRLKVRCLGGDGAAGGATSAVGKSGGDGGKGGDAGTVMVLFDSVDYNAGAYVSSILRETSASNWQSLARRASQYLSTASFSRPRREDLDFLVRFSDALSSQTSVPLVQSGDYVQRFLADDQSTISSELLKLINDPATNRGLPEVVDEFSCQKLREVLDEVKESLAVNAHKQTNDIASRIHHAPGIGGRAGTNDVNTENKGKRGASGTVRAKEPYCRYIPQSGQTAFQDVPFAYAFPDQCRMLLQRADAQFFTATPESLSVARELYERLRARLSFVEPLGWKGAETKTLHKAYTDTIDGQGLSISSLDELTAMLKEAEAKLSRLLLGQDMFGQSPEWAPRLSYYYFSERIDDMLQRYRTLQARLVAFEEAKEDSTKKGEAIAKVLESSNTDQKLIASRLKSIFDQNGPLQTAVYKIRTFDPIMKAQKVVLKKQIEEDIAEKIQSSIDVKLVLDALSGIASSDSKASLAKNTAVGVYKLYKSTTVVTDADGNTFDKKLIVNDIKGFGGTLESLQNDVKTNADSTVGLEDPGAMKILAAKEDISKIMTQFKDLLPGSTRKRISKGLDEHIKTILDRNSAVLEYNATRQLVSELQAQSQAQKDRVAALAPLKGSKLDSGLPAIVNFLTKTRDDFALAIMRELDSGARAIRFWGLPNDLPERSDSLLRGVAALEDAREHLKTIFKNCLDDQASTVWSSWPAKEKDRGVMCKVDEPTLKALKTVQIDSKSGQKVYTASIPLFPEYPGLESLQANVRLHQVRFWITNAATRADDTDRQLLSVNLTHTGTERIVSSSGTSFKFTHAPVDIGFAFDCRGVTSIKATKASLIHGTQSIEGDYKGATPATANSVAPLGPYTIWKITIKEQENPGLDLSRADAMYFEFCGRSKPFQS